MTLIFDWREPSRPPADPSPIPLPSSPDERGRLEALERENAKLRRINQVLMDRDRKSVV